MPAPLSRQRGFSLPEVILAMVLMVMVVTALSGYQRALMNSFFHQGPVPAALAAGLAADATAFVFATC